MPGPGKRDWKVSIWFSLGKEAIDKLTSTTWPLAAAILSGFPLSPILSSVFWLPTSKSPLWATLIQLHASKGRSKGFFLKDNAWVCSVIKPRLTSLKGECYELDSEKLLPIPVWLFLLLLWCCCFVLKGIFEYHILIWLLYRLKSGSVNQFYMSTKWFSPWFWRLNYSNIM